LRGKWRLILSRDLDRDIQALCEAGVPIAAEPGGGYRIMAGYYLPPVALTPEEATALFLGSAFVLKYTDASLKEAAQSAMRKIESILPKEIRNRIERLRQALFVPVPWRRRYDAEDRTNVLTAIQEAIVHRRVVRIQYHAASTGAITEREVEPLGLVYYSDHWHLIGFCRLRNEMRDFRTDRIARIEMLKEIYLQRGDFETERYLEEQWKLDEAAEVKVRFKAEVLPQVREWMPYGFQGETPDGEDVVMTFRVGSVEDFWHWIMHYSDQAEVIEPEALRKKMLREAKKMVRLYATTA